jgi:RNA recognition motif-containing protein
MSKESRENLIHLTELTWRIHATDPEDKNKLRDLIAAGIKKYKEAQGNPDYQTGAIFIGNISMYFNPESIKGRDYKYAKIECRNREDYNTLIEMKYIEIENNVSRILPNMSKNDIEKYFNNPDQNCVVTRVPKEWNHKDLYDYFSQFGKMYSVKVSKSYFWHGKREDYIGNLLNTQYEEWRQTDYEIVHNGFGYASFMHPEDQKKCLEDYKTKILPTI